MPVFIISNVIKFKIQTGMKVRQCGQKQKANRAKIFDNNYLSARDCQNQSKLANLLNLSQFCLNDIINKPDSSLVVSLNNKLAHRKNASVINGPTVYTTAAENIKQAAPSRAQGDCSKNKKAKLTKRHVLSCNEILSIAKKRDVYSELSLQPTKNHIFTNYVQPKTKRKFKREIMMSKNQNSCKSKINKHSLFLAEITQPKAPITKHDILSNFIASYPLSMSHSYIAFSEKDSSLNNTANILNKAEKKLSKSSESKYSELHDKLELIKVEHAATVIQKNWRGYLTRKLLLDCINNQETILADRLSRLKAQKIAYENFQKMVPQCNQFWTHRQYQSPSSSQILQRGMAKAPQVNPLHFEPISDLSSLNGSESEHCQSLGSEQQGYERKTPVINGALDENQVFESILKCERGFNLTSREKKDADMFMPNKPSKENWLEQKIMFTLNSSQKVTKLRKLQIIPQFNNTIIPDPRTVFSEILKSEFNVKKMTETFMEKIKSEANVKIEELNKSLKQKLMSSLIQFDEMLNVRQKLKQIKSQLDTETDKFLLIVENLFNQISQKEDPKNIEIDMSNQIEKQEGYESREQSNRNKDQMEGTESRSPISEYFTIELPTEQLSPFKPTISSGLASLKAYIQNLHQECLQEPQSSETSYLCKILKKQSQMSPENMVERCVIQMLVEMLTGQYMLEDLLLAVQSLTCGSQSSEKLQQTPSILFIQKWAAELEKWELGPIEEVSGNMQESVDVTERNQTARKPRNFNSKEWQQQL